MTRRAPPSPCRRRRTLRRLFYCATLLPLVTQGPTGLHAQDESAPRILERQIRLTLDESGEYRVIEALLVQHEQQALDPAAPSRPMPLLALQDEATGARGLGGDVPPRRVVREGNRLVIVGEVPRPVFEIAVTYRLPRDVPALVLRAVPPVDALTVFVDRGRVEARPEAGLLREEDVGPASQPSVKYAAGAVPAGGTLRIRLTADRTEWRERFGVMAVTLVAAATAGFWVWRRSDQLAGP